MLGKFANLHKIDFLVLVKISLKISVAKGLFYDKYFLIFFYAITKIKFSKLMELLFK